MPRFYYHVVTSGLAQWEIKFDGQSERFVYDSQQAAVNAAADAAKREHEINGVLTGVRVQDRSSQWREERTYGKDPFPPRG